MASLVPLLELNNSTPLPALGLGTVAVYHNESPDSVKSGILRAMEIGYRHFDTSSDYKSEEAVGSAIKDAITSGLVKREEVFVTTKIAPHDLHVEEILPQIKLSLSKLDMDYVDCFMIHWPIRQRPGSSFKSTDPEDFLPLDWKVLWPAMEKLVELGLTKSLGVSNMGVKKLQELIPHAKILPAINQVEMHPQWQQEKLRAFCQKKNIHVSAWAPIGAPGTPYGLPSMLENPILKEIAEKHKKTVAQICLRWVIEVGASALPKSFEETWQIENFSIWDFKLTDDDHGKIKTIKQCSLCSGRLFPFLKGSPWTFEEFFSNDE